MSGRTGLNFGGSRHLLCDVNCETELIFRYIVQCFIPNNKRINTILPSILIFVIPDDLILHLSLLLYIYCENVQREIYAMRPLRDHIRLNVNAIFRVRYIDLRGLPSGILLRKV